MNTVTVLNNSICVISRQFTVLFSCHTSTKTVLIQCVTFFQFMPFSTNYTSATASTTVFVQKQTAAVQWSTQVWQASAGRLTDWDFIREIAKSLPLA